jgi:ABC-2 type transport system permease protein
MTTRTHTYTWYEILRTFRNRRFFIFSLGFPLVLYFLIAGPNRNEHNIGSSGISAPVYFMVGLVAFGAMTAVLASGARIAGERAVGWNRQLRITPLSTRTYFRAKVATGYLMALVTIALLYLSGVSLGVRLAPSRWVDMTLLILVGLVPFVPLGILMGHLLNVDSVGPAMGGTTAVFALLGGTWFPLGSGVLNDIGQALPSYWLVRASRVAIGSGGWGARGWLVVGAWTLVLTVLAARAYLRDTRRA